MAIHRAPWDDKIVASLTAYQKANAVHGYTCPIDGHLLKAKSDGWHCPKCNYTQNWANYMDTVYGTPYGEGGGMRTQLSPERAAEIAAMKPKHSYASHKYNFKLQRNEK